MEKTRSYIDFIYDKVVMYKIYYRRNFVKAKAPKSYSKELIELLFEHLYCKTEYLTGRLGISRITAAKYLKELKKIKILQQNKFGKKR